MSASNHTESSPGGRKPKLPQWAKEHFQESLDSHTLLIEITSISARGIKVLRNMPDLLKYLAEADEDGDSPLSPQHLANATKEAELAGKEADKDFPVLHGLAVVALWSWMEHFVKGFVALWLTHRPDALEASAVQKLRVKLGEYLQLDKAEQAQFLVELLEQELSSPLKRGAARFDSLLQPFGLSFKIPEGVSEKLFELQQVRNAIAHRNGRADRRLRAACPWLNLEINQPITVSRDMLVSYSEATSKFLLAFLFQVRGIYNPGFDFADQESLTPPPNNAPPREETDDSK